MPDYTLVNNVTYTAADDDEAGMIAARIVALPLAEESVYESEGDFYYALDETPLNKRTLDASRAADSHPEAGA